MGMDIGSTCPIMVRCGLPLWRWIGPPTELEDGYGNHIGVGPGSLTNLGAGLLITTAAGSFMARHGYGGQDRSTAIPITGRCGRRRMYLSSDSRAVAGGRPLDLSGWVGWRVDSVLCFS